MKKFATAALLITLLSSASLPAFAQKSASASSPAVKSGAIQFDAIDAVSDGKGVLIRWQMTVETGNIGFFVYRVGVKGLEQVNSLIPGSATRINDRPLFGEQYETYDPQGTSNTTYVIQYVTTDGRRVSTDQISAKYVSNLASVAGRTKEALENKVTAAAKNSSFETTNIADKSVRLPSEPESDLATHLLVVGQPGAKIGVKSEGLYRVTRTELQAAGFNLAGNSTNWRLYLEGIEQPIIVGASDQYIEFYGKGIDTVEADTRYYYLIVGSAAGMRMGTRTLRSIRGPVIANNFRVNTEKKERITYVSSILNGDADNYWGQLVLPGSSTFITVPVTGIDFTAQAIPFTINMQGFTTGGPHAVTVKINNVQAGTINGDGALPFSGVVSVQPNILIEGSNTIELSGTASGIDYSYFDSVTVNYDKRFQADQHALKFANPRYKTATLTGFSTPDVRVFDVSQDGSPSEILGLPIQQAGCGYQVKLPSTRSTVMFAQGSTPANKTAPSTAWIPSSAPGLTDGGIVTIANNQFFTGMKARVSTTGTLPTGVSAATDYYVRKTGCDTFTLYDTYEHAVTPTKTAGLIKFCTTAAGCSAGSGNHTITPTNLTQAASVTQNNPSTLASTTRNAPVVIISYGAPDFMAAANQWATYRRSAAGGGFGVEVIDVADIYDEYSYGVFSSAAIKNFLSYAKDHWQTKYVLLLGDATYDPRNYEGFGDFDFVPTKLVATEYTGESASDDALADFHNVGLAEISIGRIPARTASVITTALNKTTTFETPAQQSFNRGALFAFDVPSGGYDFGAASQILRNELPSTMSAAMVDRGAAGSQTTLINEINTGKYIVNYDGHGSSGTWANTFFTINNVPQITNASNQSIFVMLTCLNGYFIRLNFDSLSEALLKAQNGGAAATWASTADTTPDVQLLMGQRFYNQVAAGNITRIGDLIRDAKAVLPAGTDVRFSWVLLGDPALKIR